MGEVEPADEVRKLEPGWWEVTCGTCGMTWETTDLYSRCPMCTEGA